MIGCALCAKVKYVSRLLNYSPHTLTKDTMKKTVKIPWTEFVEKAMDTYRGTFAGCGEPVFMKASPGYADSQCYEIPDYIEIEIV